MAAVQAPLARLQSQSSQRPSGISRTRVLQTRQTRKQSALHLCSHLSSPSRSCGGREGRLRSCSSVLCTLRSRCSFCLRKALHLPTRAVSAGAASSCPRDRSMPKYTTADR